MGASRFPPSALAFLLWTHRFGLPIAKRREARSERKSVTTVTLARKSQVKRVAKGHVIWSVAAPPFLPFDYHSDGDELDEDCIQDLKSCSLVSRAWLFPAQSTLFYHVVPNPYSRSHRFAELLENSPHLLAHVRSVSVTLRRPYSDILAQLANMQLPELRRIVIRGNGGSTNSLTTPVQAFLAQHPTPHIRLADITISYAPLVSVLHSELHGLHMIRCTWGLGQSVAASSLPAVHSRARIAHLSTLSCNSAILELFNNPGFPLDFSNVTHLDVRGSPTDAMVQFLERIRGTVKSLTIMSEDANPSNTSVGYRAIEPMQFPALTRLTIHVLERRWIFHSLPTFAGIRPQNGIEKIVFVLASRSFRSMSQACTDPAALFDAGFAALPLPALRRVEIRSPDAFIDRWIYGGALPLLNARGLLHCIG
ncbi:hypothetical protein DFH06DRAFT_1473749 [Mycena polygramma]|nr:hypothetical protein DFH06DRAFT_1473749 [Mycena polygramma]